MVTKGETAKEGKAIAFFGCRAKKDAIVKELPFIREFAQTPSELELSLENLKGLTPGRFKDPFLSETATLARRAGINYLMEATYPNATNRKTAEEVGGVLNQMYQSPLYGEGEKFRGEIFYQDNGKWLSLN